MQTDCQTTEIRDVQLNPGSVYPGIQQDSGAEPHLATTMVASHNEGCAWGFPVDLPGLSLINNVLNAPRLYTCLKRHNRPEQTLVSESVSAGSCGQSESGPRGVGL
ncbi:hypothetical protein F2P79_012955 [Pimephales promelas]|nr:hypothetical protein F2P79_012955 [Pimephales promelas]